MAKRVALTALLPATSEALDMTQPASPHEAHPAVPSGQSGGAPAAAPTGPTASSSPTRLQSAGNPSSRRSSRIDSRSVGHQHYSQLTRKEARLRDDQIDNLALQARRLSRAKDGSSERITDNTLIRVAIDLLLQHPDRLRGNTEAELRKSVGL